VYFEESPQAEEPQDIMMRELPQFCMFHVPMEIFLFYKTRKEEIKRELFM
jgi:hypothetical protein